MPVVTVHGEPVRYDRSGRGPTVVLLHGGGLDSARLSWAPLTTRMVGHAEVLAPDLPGYGGSPLGSTPATVAVPDELVDEVQDLARTPAAGVAWRAFQRHEVRLAGPRTVFGDVLARIVCPAVLLVGEHDIVSPAAVRAAAARIPRGAFAEVPAAGHWLPRDAPDAVATHLLELTHADGRRRYRRPAASPAHPTPPATNGAS